MLVCYLHGWKRGRKKLDNMVVRWTNTMIWSGEQLNAEQIMNVVTVGLDHVV